MNGDAHHKIHLRAAGERLEPMKAATLLCMAATLLAGCKDASSVASADTSVIPHPYPLELVLLSLLPGSTNTGVTPQMVLRTYAAGAATMGPTFAEDLEKKAQFVSADGDTVGVAPVTREQAGQTYAFMLQPAAPLLANTWYSVTYPSDTLLKAGMV